MENLKARELRIGNYLNYNAIRIKLDERIFISLLSNDGLLLIEKLEPIPLTEDILLKCGFVKSTIVEGCFIHNKHERLYVSIINPIAIHLGNKNGVLVMLYYLHTLQNLYFALTNEELTIKL